MIVLSFYIRIIILIKLDTIKVSIPEYTIEDFDKRYFNITPFIDGESGELNKSTYISFKG